MCCFQWFYTGMDKSSDKWATQPHSLFPFVQSTCVQWADELLAILSTGQCSAERADRLTSVHHAEVLPTKLVVLMVVVMVVVVLVVVVVLRW
jgi:hypothetical protein